MGVSQEMSSEVGGVSKIQDEGRLAELGYTQELQRDWGFWHNAGASFSIIVSYTALFITHSRRNAVEMGGMLEDVVHTRSATLTCLL